MGKAKLEIKKYKFDYISLILNIIIFGILPMNPLRLFHLQKDGL